MRSESQNNSNPTVSTEDILRRIDTMCDDAYGMRLRETQHAYELSLEAIALSREAQYDKGLASGMLVKGTCEGLDFKNDESLASLDEAERIFTLLGDELGIATTLTSRSATQSNIGQFREALDNSLDAAAIARKLGAKQLLIRALSAAGVCYAKSGEYDNALVVQAEALEYAREENDHSSLVVILTGMGICHQRQADYGVALECFFEANRNAVLGGNIRQEATTLCNIGTTYGQLGQSHTSLEYFSRGLKLHEQTGNLRSQALVLKNMSEEYTGSGDYAIGLNHAMRSLKLFQSIGDTSGKSVALRTIGLILQGMGQYENACTYLLRSAHLSEDLAEKHETQSSFQSLGEIYLQLGRYEDALETFDKVLKSSTSVDMQTLAHEGLARAYRLMGNEAESRVHRDAYLGLVKSHFSLEKQEKMKNLIAQFEYEQSIAEAGRAGLSTEDLANASDALRMASELKADSVSLVQPVLATSMNDFHDIGEDGDLPDPGATSFHLQTFGRFVLRIDGHVVTSEDWQRKKARDVFKVLLLNYGKSVSAEELIELVWPDSQMDNPEPSLWNATSCIRRVLEPGLKAQTPSKYITVTDKSYRLDLGKEATIDFLDFKKLVSLAQGVRDERARKELFEQAVELYHGDFLKEDLTAEWASFERMLLKEQYIDALMTLANYAKAQGDNEKTLRLATRALEADATFEAAYDLILRIYREESRSADMKKLMERCKKAFSVELGSVPPRRLTELGDYAARGVH